MSKRLSTEEDASRGSAATPSGSVTPLGINKRWKSDEAQLKQVKSEAAVRKGANSPAHQRFASLNAYASGDNPFIDPVDPTQPYRGPLSPQVAGALWGDPMLIRRWAVPLLQGASMESWLPDFAHDTAYAYWRWRVEFEGRRNDGRIFLEIPASVLASCLYLGWMDEARIVAESIRQAYGQRRVANVSGRECQPLNHCLLRVAFDYWDMPFDGWGKGHNPRLDPRLDPKNIFKKNECFGEPVLNVLYDHWRDPDLSAFTDHLVWAADYTTHRLNTDCEFAYGGQLAACMPGMLLPLARFRSCLGVGMPTIPHPLLAAPYAALPERHARYVDPLLERVLDRLTREELPQLLD